jgi:hypothetical protein
VNLEYLTIGVTILVALITSVIGPILVDWAKTRIAKSEKKGLVDEAIDTNALVDDQLHSRTYPTRSRQSLSTWSGFTASTTS